ncbi:MAG: VCBS repeat-containing protein, partial [Saprospiraceae bacterium]|nr:VCBS repeat-containing protein [Saprospiraceae bacterium]
MGQKTSNQKPNWVGRLILPLALLLCSSAVLEAQFTRVSGDLNLGITSPNSGGQAWGDLNEDGYLDVIVFDNSTANSAASKMFLNNGPPNYTFNDVTNSKINGWNTAVLWGRQMVVADFNNDGYNDVLRGGGGITVVEVYFNDGPPNYTFGNALQNADFTISSTLVT